MPTKELMPAFEVSGFLDQVAAGKKQSEIALLLGVHKNTVSRWTQDGMPLPKARELLARYTIELSEKQAVENKKLAELMELYGL